MKKWLMLLFVLMLTGVSYAEKLSYEIDDEATSAAIWNVGDSILKKILDDPELASEIRFLGITVDGNFIVQNFYLVNESKATDPYLVKPSNVSYLGVYKSYYPTGARWTENYISPPYGINISWFENGNISGLMFSDATNIVGITFRWDETGYLSSMSVYGENNRLLTWILFGESGRIMSLSLHNPENPNLECTWDFGRLVVKQWECLGAK